MWICQNLTGPATLQAPPFEPVAAVPFVFWFEEDEGAWEGPVDIQITASGPSVTVHEVESEPTVADTDAPVVIQAAPEDTVAPAFAHFEQALAAALLAQSASRAAAILPKMLRLEALSSDALTKDVQLTLQSRGYLDSSGRYSPRFRELCGAWTAVLQGSSQDFAACGTTTLDRFGADLLAALLAVPATRSDELRRELRKAGVAAFGILEAAA